MKIAYIAANCQCANIKTFERKTISLIPFRGICCARFIVYLVNGIVKLPWHRCWDGNKESFLLSLSLFPFVRFPQLLDSIRSRSETLAVLPKGNKFKSRAYFVPFALHLASCIRCVRKPMIVMFSWFETKWIYRLDLTFVDFFLSIFFFSVFVYSIRSIFGSLEMA